MIYLVMVIAGIILLVWIKGRSKTNTDPTPPLPPEPPSPPSPPPTPIADDINRIYIYIQHPKKAKKDTFGCVGIVN